MIHLVLRLELGPDAPPQSAGGHRPPARPLSPDRREHLDIHNRTRQAERQDLSAHRERILDMLFNSGSPVTRDVGNHL